MQQIIVIDPLLLFNFSKTKNAKLIHILLLISLSNIWKSFSHIIIPQLIYSLTNKSVNKALEQTKSNQDCGKPITIKKIKSIIQTGLNIIEPSKIYETFYYKKYWLWQGNSRKYFIEYNNKPSNALSLQKI